METTPAQPVNRSASELAAATANFQSRLDTYTTPAAIKNGPEPAHQLFTERVGSLEAHLGHVTTLTTTLDSYERNILNAVQNPSFEAHKGEISQAFHIVKTIEGQRLFEHQLQESLARKATLEAQGDTDGARRIESEIEEAKKANEERVAEKDKQSQQLYEFFQDFSPGISGVLAAHLPELPDEPTPPSDENDEAAMTAYKKAVERRQQIRDLPNQLRRIVSTNLAYFVVTRNTVGKKESVPSFHGEQINDAARFLLENAPQFEDLVARETEDPHSPQAQIVAKNKLNPESEDIRADAAALGEALSAQEAMYMLDPSLAGESIRSWITQTGREARRGSRIYKTPYYRRIIAEAARERLKANGIGGIVYYGPPGTGKTEVIKEINRMQGFSTQVINIHHYIGFAELIGKRAIQLGVDPGLSMAQKLDAVVKTFDQTTPVDFGAAITDMFQSLKKDGKVDPEMTMHRWLRGFVDESATEDLLESKDPTEADEWSKVKEGFLTRQRARIARTALSGSMQEEGEEDIVLGDIAEAAKNHKRVVLDELDKAGPNSMSGILSILAQPPGSTFTLGGKEIELPADLVIDATSNSFTKLSPELRGRFTGLSIDPPPLLDTLMIAAVRVSSSEGDIGLTPREQNQLDGFFSYFAPEMSRVLVDARMPPLAIRELNQFTSYLYDFRAQQRTSVTFEDAVNKFINELTLRNIPTKDGATGPAAEEAARKDVIGKFAELQKKFAALLEEPTQEQRAYLDISGTLPQLAEKLDRNSAIREKFTAARAARGNTPIIERSPLINALHELEVHSDIRTSSMGALHDIVLDAKQREAVEKHVTRDIEQETDESEAVKLGNGLVIDLSTAGEYHIKPLPSLTSSSQGAYVEGKLRQNETVGGASLDGRVLLKVLRSTQGNGIEVVEAGSDANKIKLSQASDNFDARLTSDGKYVGINSQTEDKGQRVLRIYSVDAENTPANANQSTQPTFEKVSVESFAFSPDGKYLLVCTGGNTEIYDPATSRLVTKLSGSHWRFAENQLVVNAPTSGGKVSVQQEAVYIS